MRFTIFQRLAARSCAGAVLCILACGTVAGQRCCASDELIEIQWKGETSRGKSVAHDKQRLWFMSPAGSLKPVEFEELTAFKPQGRQFRPLTLGELRDQLRRECPGLELAGTGNYIVAARPGLARGYAEVFDSLARAFHVYFAARGFKVPEPEFPLAAIIFPTANDFARYAANEGVRVSPGLRGYYHSRSNRVALFESGERAEVDRPTILAADHDFAASWFRPQDGVGRRSLAAELGLHADGSRAADGRGPFAAGSDHSAWANFEGSLHDTIIHEGTHQVAFNTGLHSRIGENPRWVVEGLATVFEAPGIRMPGSAGKNLQRVNPERFIRFGNYRQTRRPKKSLEAFLASDKLFAENTLDAYSQAWALTFFLVETRPSAYGNYLKSIAARDPLKAGDGAQRVADFQRAFGNDLSQFEAEFLRYLAGIH